MRRHLRSPVADFMSAGCTSVSCVLERSVTISNSGESAALKLNCWSWLSASALPPHIRLELNVRQVLAPVGARSLLSKEDSRVLFRSLDPLFASRPSVGHCSWRPQFLKPLSFWGPQPQNADNLQIPNVLPLKPFMIPFLPLSSLPPVHSPFSSLRQGPPTQLPTHHANSLRGRQVPELSEEPILRAGCP